MKSCSIYSQHTIIFTPLHRPTKNAKLSSYDISQRLLFPFRDRYTKAVQNGAAGERVMGCDTVTFLFSFNECSFYLFPLPAWWPQGNSELRCRMIYMLMWHKQTVVTTTHLFCWNWTDTKMLVFLRFTGCYLGDKETTKPSSPNRAGNLLVIKYMHVSISLMN